MRTIRRNTSPTDDMPDALRRFLLQRTVELTGFLLLAVVIAAVLALATWSVSDPSLTHATEGRVANLLGTPGAIFADLTMQIFGLGTVALLLPCAIWAVRLIGRRPLPRLVLRLALWVLGTAAASAVASALPGTERWPLPSGLGGVVGDALLFGGKGLIGDGGIGGLIVGICYAATAILALSAASGLGLSAQPSHFADDDEDDYRFAGSDDKDSPGWGIVSLGAVVHGLMVLKASVMRRFQKPRDEQTYAAPRTAREPSFDAGVMDDGMDEGFASVSAPVASAPLRAAPSRGAPRMDAPVQPRPEIPPEVAAFAPVRERPVQIHMPPVAQLQPQEPASYQSTIEDFVSVAPAAMAAAGGDTAVPAWRKPFQLPPNVRFTRSTDRELAARNRGAHDEIGLQNPEAGISEEGYPATGHLADTYPAGDHTLDFAPGDAYAAGGAEPYVDTYAEAPRAPARQDHGIQDQDGYDQEYDDYDGDHQPADRRETDAFGSLTEDDDHAGWTDEAAYGSSSDQDDAFADDDVYEASSPAMPLPDAAPVLMRHKRRPPALAPSNDDDPDQPRPARPAAAQIPAPVPAPVRAPVAAARPASVAAAPVAASASATTTRRVPVSPRSTSDYEMPPLGMLALPSGPRDTISEDALEQNAALLESTLEDFGVRGDIIHVRPGPVVTLYELEPAPGTKSSRVISLADDIARSMSAVSARVAVVPGRNAIGVELPNAKRETVYLRELLAAEEFQRSKFKLALCLGKTIGGEPVIADLARMPHLLVAGTTGSGKSVAINTMIMSLLYRLKPEECRLIMVDPKMLELSIYDGIPHLLTPVVTDPKKAVVALKWAVREMEDRYKKMSKLSVRNIDGFNTRVREAKARGEVITRTVQTGFDRDTGEAIYEDEVMDLDPLPYIVIVVDEMADLMMVAGKEIEGTIQRLAQMARAAGIHVILATQRPSVDVITGTIKANFPTRISFQVTSKIDSRTILGEQGAEQLLGQGDMLYMAGGGRVVRVHGPFVSDDEVEKIVAHLKTQGRPQYLEAVTADEEAAAEGDGAAVFDNTANGSAGGGNDLYDQAIAIVLRDKKASTSYIQRRLQIGYNRAASIMERMELEGIVGAANHAGKREILVGGDDQANHG
ncbi:DNA translocase FtsK [Pseudochelatococcus contaminans]|uniref:DNA translocase FtsK n=1 Tax=Pseudochelatococcus contaminans TaxID=1538103 RepID=A0A7W5Z2M5_9HYPH|nr:DNA translocase FtsK [Pseudochelatococcus contaminans]MBB3808947.1 DNA segregation ATPase FtsK/SpoIIIE-like protein [Pseudochelatococcus contaminans]